MEEVDVNDFTFERGVDIDNDPPRHKAESTNQDAESTNQDADTDTDDLREELISLAEKKEINKSVAYIKKASKKTLERIYERYQRDQLKETNEMVTDIIIAKSTELMEHMSLIKSGCETGKKLQNKQMFRRDMNKIVGYLTPLFPLVGLFEGVLTVGGDIFSHQMSQTTDSEMPTEG